MKVLKFIGQQLVGLFTLFCYWTVGWGWHTGTIKVLASFRTFTIFVAVYLGIIGALLAYAGYKALKDVK